MSAPPGGEGKGAGSSGGGRLVHHELCFGCGRTNLFGLLAELVPTAPHAVSGRCFVKQDHQGGDPGVAHEGIIAAALSEAMGFAAGPNARLQRLELEITGVAPVGSFLELAAEAAGTRASATASVAGQPVACASGSYGHPDDG